MTNLSRRARSIQPSATLELSARAKELKAQGSAVVDLTAGEPDLPTPDVVVQAAHRALDEQHFKYTPTAGVPALRQRIADAYAQRWGIPIAPAMTVVSNGAKQAIYNALATITDPGDKIGLLAPYWVSYLEQAHALGCEAVIVPCPAANRFRPDLDALKTAVDDGLRVLVVNSPCNPTGAAFDEDDWSALLGVVEGSDTYIISDEIYEDIVFRPGGHASLLAGRPDLAERTCVVSGLSKAYAMTGWRVGYSIAPVVWSKAMNALQGHVTSNINAVAQQAAIKALEHPEVVAPMVAVFDQRRAQVMRRVASVAGLSALDPDGTFYLYVNVRDVLDDGGRTVDELAAWLLDEHLLAVVPGTAFGDPDHARLSFAASTEDLDAAFDRLEQAFGRTAS